MTRKNLLAAACSLAMAMMAGHAAAQQAGNGDTRQARGERPELRLNTTTVQNTAPPSGAFNDRRAELRQDNREIRGDRREIAQDTREIRSDRREIMQGRAEIRQDNRAIVQSRNELREDEMQRRQHVMAMRDAARSGDTAGVAAHRDAVRRENAEIRSDRQALHGAYAERARDMRELRHDQRELHRDRQERRGDIRELRHDRREARHDRQFDHRQSHAGPVRSHGHDYRSTGPVRMHNGVAHGMNGRPGHAGGMRMAHTQRTTYRR